MAVYKIFPAADSTLYSAFPAKNTGLDEILEVSVKNSNASIDDIRRSLIIFSNDDINTINNLSSGSSWEAYLKLYLANAEGLTIPYTLEFGQVDDSWIMGTGKFSDNPETENGVCWYSTSSYITSNNSWTNPSYYITSGGGSWNNVVTESFGYKDNKDINVNISNILNNWFNGDSNNGIILKHLSSIENNNKSYIVTNFFSVDTHTIFPPCLEIRWNDSSYNTGSLSIINNSNSVINIVNNPYKIKSTTQKYEFRISARDKYPTRTFTTSSIYTSNKCLPKNSYWAIQDVKTEDIIIDFDDNYTLISCDKLGSFFSLYINGLEPERYYKILIKYELGTGESIVVDNNNIFKIIR